MGKLTFGMNAPRQATQPPLIPSHAEIEFTQPPPLLWTLLLLIAVAIVAFAVGWLL